MLGFPLRLETRKEQTMVGTFRENHSFRFWLCESFGEGLPQLSAPSGVPRGPSNQF